MADKWHEWETPWRTFTLEDQPFRMKVEYGYETLLEFWD